MACRTDPAMPLIDEVSAAMHEMFRADVACPPLVGGVKVVRFFAGDAPPLAAWDSHVSQGCEEPFVWVRAVRRYRSRTFPNPTVATECSDDYLRVIAIEVGVGFCAVTEQEPKWSEYQREAEISMDVGWRMELALCIASGQIKKKADVQQHVGLDTIVPYGPEGGVIAWTSQLYASY